MYLIMLTNIILNYNANGRVYRYNCIFIQIKAIVKLIINNNDILYKPF